MPSFLEKILGKSTHSANHAKERLHLVLIHDRTDLTPEKLESLKNRLIDVISEYVSIDESKIEIEVKTNGRERSLIANIPLKTLRSSR
jgi:cell division topological specificity factor